MKIHSLATLLLLAFMSSGFQEAFSGSSRLQFTKPLDDRVEIDLKNDDRVAGLQFTITATGGINLISITLSGRTEDGLWSVTSFNTSDSVMNVVILRKYHNYLSPGDGAIAELRFEVSDAQSAHSISFSRCVVSTPQATGLELDLVSLEWTLPSPQLFTLGQNYPNPFNPSTSIPFTLSEPTNVTLTVYDITGRQIKRITDGMLAAGNHTVTWDSIDESGTSVPSGVYFIALRAGGAIQVRKVALTR